MANKMRIVTYCWLLASCLTVRLAGAVPLEHQKTSPHPPLKNHNNKDDSRNINNGNNIDGNENEKKDPPNIILIVADDMGWNDVSFHGSDQIPTPNIDALAYNGVILNSHYVSAMCTPSRAALLTGKHPIHLGMQHLVILEAEPRGLPLSEKLLPQYLKELGYSTHALGKWHQGFHRREYTPTYRGFDTHFGYWNGLQDYYTHEVASSRASEGYLGFDMRRNMSVAHDTRGKYSTDLFTEEAVRLIDEHNSQDGPMFMYFAHLAPHSGNDKEPLQAPDDYVARFGYIDDPERRIYAAMMAKLDESVGEVVAALRRNHMLQNSVVVFMADNGAATQGIHYNRGSNYPLRGIKASAWEGAIRGAAAVWSPLIRHPKRVSDELMYIGDWMPTLLTLAGGEDKIPSDIDGMDMWTSISEGLASPRQELLLNIDPVFNYSTLRRSDFKYVLGTVGNGEEWYGESGRIEKAHIEGLNPTYDTEAVMSSGAGRAISALLTKRQASEIRTLRSTTYDKVKDEDMSTASLLSAEEILALRTKATIHCSIEESKQTPCNPRESACLFNIREDPCEKRNLASSHLVLVAALEEILEKYKLSAIPPTNAPNDPRANPALWNNTWVNWLDDDPLEFQRVEDDQRTTSNSGNSNSNGATVSKNPLVVEDGTGFNGPVMLFALVLLGLALLAIIAMLYLSCSARYNRLKKKEKQSAYNESRHFQEIHEPIESRGLGLHDESYVASKLLEKNGKIDAISSNGIEC